MVGFAVDIIVERRACTRDEAFLLLSDAADGNDMSISDLALCIVAHWEINSSPEPTRL